MAARHPTRVSNACVLVPPTASASTSPQPPTRPDTPPRCNLLWPSSAGPMPDSPVLVLVKACAAPAAIASRAIRRTAYPTFVQGQMILRLRSLPVPLLPSLPCLFCTSPNILASSSRLLVCPANATMVRLPASCNRRRVQLSSPHARALPEQKASPLLGPSRPRLPACCWVTSRRTPPPSWLALSA